MLLCCKEEISKSFAGQVVAHSLRDCLNEHKGCKLALLKIDFRNAFNEVKRPHFVKAASTYVRLEEPCNWYAATQKLWQI